MLVSIVTIASLNAWGEKMDAPMYNASCNAPRGTHEAQLCDMLVLGEVEGMLVSQAMNETGEHSCLPDNLYANKIIETYRSFIKEHPVGPGRRILGRNNVWDALTQAFPCKRP